MWRVGYIFNHADIVGGGELSFVDLVGAVGEAGVEPVAFVPGPGPVQKKLKSIGVTVREAEFPPIRPHTIASVARQQCRLAKQFQSLKLDLVHTNGARSMLYTGPAAKRAGLPCVWHVRVLNRDRILDWIRSLFASMIIANSIAVASSLNQVITKGKRVEIIYNGFDLARFQAAAPADLKRTFGIPKGPVVLGVGRFSPWKKFEDLISACAMLHRRSCQVSLLLVGHALEHERGYEEKLRRLVAETGLRRVFFAGWRDDVVSIMKSCDVFVLPSDGEPFGRVIVEAWASRVPVIATNVGGPAELIRDEVDALLVPPCSPFLLSSAIERILKDDALGSRLAESAAERVKDFSLQSNIAAVVQTYGRFLSLA